MSTNIQTAIFKNKTTEPGIGCYGHSSLGHQRTREACAKVLEDAVYSKRVTRFEAFVAGNFYQSLKGPMPDDAWDEHNACDWLEDYYSHPDATWGWRDGDFGLWPDENEDRQAQTHTQETGR
jgi:hypothetical protein